MREHTSGQANKEKWREEEKIPRKQENKKPKNKAQQIKAEARRKNLRKIKGREITAKRKCGR